MTLSTGKSTTRRPLALSRRRAALADLGPLLERISRGSRAAFATLYDGTADVLRAELESRLVDREGATSIVASTYVEIWWMAACQTGPDPEIRLWINTIVQRRVSEVRPDLHSPYAGYGAVDLRSRCAVLELAGLLGRPVHELDPCCPPPPATP